MAGGVGGCVHVTGDGGDLGDDNCSASQTLFNCSQSLVCQTASTVSPSAGALGDSSPLTPRGIAGSGLGAQLTGEAHRHSQNLYCHAMRLVDILVGRAIEETMIIYS